MPSSDSCCLLQNIYVAWPAFDWVLKPSKGNADPPDCITAMVQLLHHLLICKPAELDMTQACCLGVPILLRYLTSSSIHDRHSCELVKVVLDILAADPGMVIAYKDDQLWSALHQLLTVACKLHCVLHSCVRVLLAGAFLYISLFIYLFMSIRTSRSESTADVNV